MEWFRQYAEFKRNEIIRKAASKLNGKVEGEQVVLGDGAYEDEYNGKPFISRTLGEEGIRPK